MQTNEDDWMDWAAWNEHQEFMLGLERRGSNDDVIYTLNDLFEFARFIAPRSNTVYMYKEWIKVRHLKPK